MKKLYVVAVNGVSLAGKDSYCNAVAKLHLRLRSEIYLEMQCGTTNPHVRTISSIDFIKELYTQMGWDGKKTDEDRKNLNTLKSMWASRFSGTEKWFKKYLEEEPLEILFVMVREFEEMELFRKICNEYTKREIEFLTLRIVRDRDENTEFTKETIPPVELEFIESHPQSFIYDITIYNKHIDHEKWFFSHTASDSLIDSAIGDKAIMLLAYIKSKDKPFTVMIRDLFGECRLLPNPNQSYFSSEIEKSIYIIRG